MQKPTTKDPRLALLRRPAKKNLLDGITLYETVDIQILEQLIHSTLLRKEFNNEICKVWHENEKRQLEKYRETLVGDRARIRYSKPSNNEYGRCNPEHGIGLHNIRREIRHTLGSDSYEDVDIDNCHPSVLVQILKQAGIEAPLLTDYVKNRQKWLDLVNKHYQILDLEKVKEQPHLKKDIPKDLFIRLLYGGGSMPWVAKHGIKVSYANQKLIDFENEVQTIGEWIAMANPEIYEKAVELKKDESSNYYGTTCSYYMQEIESQMLETIYLYCVNNGYIVNDNAVLCADGLMIEKNRYNAKLLIELENEIREKHGFDVKFSNKKMELGYNSVLYKSLQFEIDGTTSGLAKMFKALYMHEFVYTRGQLYRYTGVYWKKENDRRNTSIHLKLGEMEKRVAFEWSRIMEEQKKLVEVKGAIGEASEYKEDKEEEELTTCGDIDKNTKEAKQRLREEAKEIDRKAKEAKQKLRANSKKLLEMSKPIDKAMNLLKNYGPRCGLADDIINTLTANHIEMDTNGDLIAFENGIYDLSVGNWIKPHYKQYVSMTTGWNWNFRMQSDHRCMDGLLKQIFPNPAIRDHYLTILSTGLWGKQIEKIFNAKGEGGNGKGLLNSLMMYAIGDYGYSMPSLVLTDNMKDGPNPTVVALHKKRFVVCAEPDAKKTIKSDTVKILTGEGKLTTRQLYESITDVILWITLIMECNGQPNFDEMNDAIARRLDVIPFVSSFKEKYKYDDEVRGMTEEEIRESNIYVADMYFKSDEFKNNNKQALIEILFENFAKFRKNGYTFVDAPKECKEATNAYMEKSDNTYGWFCENYEKGEGLVFIKDIFNEYKMSDLYLNMTKQEKRNNNLKNFKNEIQTNVFLRKFYRNADTYYNKIKYTQPYIVGYLEINKRKYMGGGFEEEIEETKE